MRNINILPTENLNSWMLYVTLTETKWERQNEQRRTLSFFFFFFFVHFERKKTFLAIWNRIQKLQNTHTLFISEPERGRKIGSFVISILNFFFRLFNEKMTTK